MKTDLKTNIKFYQVSNRYYRPENEIELASLTRYEKVTTRVEESAEQGARIAALEVANIINKCIESKGRCVIGFGAGRYVFKVYDELVKLYFADKVSFADVVAFNLSELCGDNDMSLHRLIQEQLYAKVDIEPDKIHTINNLEAIDNAHELCKAYEREILEAGGLDLVLCDLNNDGSIAYNEPGSARDSACRLMLLGSESRTRVAEVFQSDTAPKTAVTLGIGNILKADKVICVAWDEDSANALFNTIEGKMTDLVPASFLQVHNDAQIIADLDAASHLTRISYPWKVTSCEWNDHLIRRAIVWLCEQTGKPVLKLTNKDYNDYGLSELVALYDSAYNVNIKIFNDLQHTITGWPGGKPNADDTYRPEREKPYPKRVLVFSPHPDDVVVSMGGTVRRLVQQGHDVRIAFQTDGDVAVSDEDLMRNLILAERVMRQYEPERNVHFIQQMREKLNDRSNASEEDNAIRYFKGSIILSEAYMACRQMGVPRENLYDLRMPFYTNDPHGQGKLTDEDVAVVQNLILQVKPHQIFIDNDLVDPNGVHMRASGAVMHALDNLKDEEFMRDCRVWMYRGQWGQWDVDHVEMAVPMSPEEFSDKRDAILKFQSQIHDAPFRTGTDGKLSWQRSIERNRDLAEVYQRLGLATYEAIEAFVQYRFRNE
ncbi:MAG: glucosamine-6-phosphate deaminase [Muribaculaceae bacterium]|nr:glucosamine-6-phosphate deaminase [Muribaculaceae bacterium]